MQILKEQKINTTTILISPFPPSLSTDLPLFMCYRSNYKVSNPMHFIMPACLFSRRHFEQWMQSAACSLFPLIYLTCTWWLIVIDLLWMGETFKKTETYSRTDYISHLLPSVRYNEVHDEMQFRRETCDKRQLVTLFRLTKSICTTDWATQSNVKTWLCQMRN